MRAGRQTALGGPRPRIIPANAVSPTERRGFPAAAFIQMRFSGQAVLRILPALLLPAPGRVPVDSLEAKGLDRDDLERALMGGGEDHGGGGTVRVGRRASCARSRTNALRRPPPESGGAARGHPPT